MPAFSEAEETDDGKKERGWVVFGVYPARRAGQIREISLPAHESQKSG